MCFMMVLLERTKKLENLTIVYLVHYKLGMINIFIKTLKANFGNNVILTYQICINMCPRIWVIQVCFVVVAIMDLKTGRFKKK